MICFTAVLLFTVYRAFVLFMRGDTSIFKYTEKFQGEAQINYLAFGMAGD